MRQELVSRICSPFRLWKVGHPVVWGGDQIGLFNPLFLALLVQAKRRKGKERKKEEKENLVRKFQDIKVRKNILTLPLFGFFFFFELGFRLAWIFFWFGLEFSGEKDKKNVYIHVGILGEVLSKFS